MFFLQLLFFTLWSIVLSGLIISQLLKGDFVHIFWIVFLNISFLSRTLPTKFQSLQVIQSLNSVFSSWWGPMFYLGFPSLSNNLESISRPKKKKKRLLCPYLICFLSLRNHSLVLPIVYTFWKLWLYIYIYICFWFFSCLW